MSEHPLIVSDAFWKFLVSIEELSEKKDKNIFCASIDIKTSDLNDFQKFLDRFELHFEMDDLYVYPLKTKNKIKMEFSLSEWFALQANFQQMTQLDQNFKFYFQKIVRNKLTLAQSAHEQFNLYRRPLDLKAREQEQDNLKKKLDHVIAHQRTIKLSFHNNKECSIFPQRLVFLDGILCVIGESTKEKNLVYFGLEDIKGAELLEEAYDPHLSQIEINEFICHLRLINGKEERLVLKIYSQYETDLLPSHHFLGNPFVTSNVDGDMIWAATIEMCDDVFQWLYSMRDRVEVLDPGHVSREFSNFCEMKKEENVLKKAS